MESFQGMLARVEGSEKGIGVEKGCMRRSACSTGDQGRGKVGGPFLIQGKRGGIRKSCHPNLLEIYEGDPAKDSQ